MIQADIIIAGAGAAGLAAAVFAGEAAREVVDASALRILLLDGAKTPGAKILASGGGRCNVTHERVTPDDYSGGPRPIIRSVLRAFGERRALEWMKSLGVPLKLEPAGKVFPVSDDARTVLEALLRRVRELGVQTVFSSRVTGIARIDEGFKVQVAGGAESFHAKRLILAAGGLALPKSGSDGVGLTLAARLGHTIVPPHPGPKPPRPAQKFRAGRAVRGTQRRDG